MKREISKGKKYVFYIFGKNIDALSWYNRICLL